MEKQSANSTASLYDLCQNQNQLNQFNHPYDDQNLKEWFFKECQKRLSCISPQNNLSIEEALELPNRLPENSLELIDEANLINLKSILPTSEDFKKIVKLGINELQNNKCNSKFSTAVRAIPGGGASSRASSWIRMNPEFSKKHHLSESQPRQLYRTNNRSLLEWTLGLSTQIANHAKRIIPNLLMTSSESLPDFVNDAQSWSFVDQEHLKHTTVFNQIELPRLYTNDLTAVPDRLFPSGHGDFPYLLSKLGLIDDLVKQGFKYLVFSNSDEWLWQADPFVIGLAATLFDEDHHMVIMGVDNTHKQMGGAFVRFKNGKQSLVETPRLPKDVLKNKEAPLLLNSTFYVMNIGSLAQKKDRLLEVKKSLVVKEIPGRLPGTTESIVGVDSYAGDVFSDVLNPLFVRWPRSNFLGIKDGSHLYGTTPRDDLNGLSSEQFLTTVTQNYERHIEALFKNAGTHLNQFYENNFSYL